jgi:DNA adenine methylase
MSRADNNGFVKYNQKIFSWADQVRLRDDIKTATDRGALCLVMNANHKSVVELYGGIGSKRALSRKSVISGSASARGIYNKLAIMVGYEPAAESPVTRSILASSLPMARSAVSTS